MKPIEQKVAYYRKKTIIVTVIVAKSVPSIVVRRGVLDSGRLSGGRDASPGKFSGRFVGSVVLRSVGTAEGATDGMGLGMVDEDGRRLGLSEGNPEGCCDGDRLSEGEPVGSGETDGWGVTVGCMVGISLPSSRP